MKNIVLIDDEREFVKDFNAILKQWDLNEQYNVIPIYDFNNDDSVDLVIDSIISKFKDIITKEESISHILVDIALTKDESIEIDESNGQEESGNILSGFVLIKELRKIIFDIPIIALTRLSAEHVYHYAYNYDVDGFISKMKLSKDKRDSFIGKIDNTAMVRAKLIENAKRFCSNNQAFGYGFSSRQQFSENSILQNSIESVFDNESTKSIVFFADLCGSVDIKEKLGFNEGLLFCSIHNKIVTKIIHNFGGRIVKYIGDCVMAEFEVSKPELSINCAACIMEELEVYNINKRGSSPYKLETTIGISIGDVLYFYGDDPHGKCVDLAARLNSTAENGQILISEDLYDNIIPTNFVCNHSKANPLRSIKDYFSGVEKQKLKGFSEEQKYVQVFWKL